VDGTQKEGTIIGEETDKVDAIVPCYEEVT
jgi:hypothetical protein